MNKYRQKTTYQVKKTQVLKFLLTIEYQQWKNIVVSKIWNHVNSNLDDDIFDRYAVMFHRPWVHVKYFIIRIRAEIQRKPKLKFSTKQLDRIFWK